MLQLSLIVVLVVSMFVGRVSPVMQKEEHEKDKVDSLDLPKNLSKSSDNVTINSKSVEDSVDATKDKEVPTVAPVMQKEEHEKSNDLSKSVDGQTNKNTSKPLEASVNTAKDKKEQVNITNNSTSSKNSDVNELQENTQTILPPKVEKGKKNCTFEKEQQDMTQCSVTPLDEDPLIENGLPLSPTESTTNSTTELTIVSLENTTHNTNDVNYTIASTEPTVLPVNANHSDVSNAKLQNKSDTRSEEIVKAKSVSEATNKRMPSGIIALVTAISFAVAIAFMYIGMIIWRRYIEYRYGHRELLVNELEFDTNDLRHFEL